MRKAIQYILALLLVAAVPAAMRFSIPTVEFKPRYGEAKTVFEPFQKETPNPFRKFLWLNGEWKFRLPGEKAWRAVAVPHVWNSIPGLENYTGRAEYSLEFEIPEDWADGKVYLHFGAVAGAAEVRFNGAAAARESSAFLPLEADVTRIARIGGGNRVEVLVDNRPDPAAAPGITDEKSFGGIPREVYIERRNRIHFTDVMVETVSMDGATAEVRVTAGLELDGYAGALVFGKIDRPDGGDPVSFDTTVSADERGKGRLVWRGEIGNAALWSPGAPALHSLGMVAIEEDGASDGVRKKFGLSVRGPDGDGIYEINGKKAAMRGVVWREQGPGGVGPVVTETQLRKDFERLAAAGFNAVRFPHPPHPAALDACDRLGILALVELPLWRGVPAAAGVEYNKQLEKLLEKTIIVNRLHPSIAAWGLGADLDPGDRKTLETVAALAKAAKRLDPARPVYAGFRAFHAAPPDTGFAAFSLVTDSHFTVEKRMKSVLKRAEKRAEKGAAKAPVLVTAFGARGIPGVKNLAGAPGSEMNQLLLVGMFENLAAASPAVQGWFIDSLTDYEGPFTDFHGRYNLVRRGLLTREREPKYAYEYLSGLEKEAPQWRFAGFFSRRLPKAELVLLVLLLLVCTAFWQGYIHPGSLEFAGRRSGRIALEFAIFGLPALVVAGLCGSFAVAARLGPETDPAGLSPVLYAAVRLWLEPAGARILALTGLQAAWLLAASVVMSLFLGFRPLAVFELVSRCAAARLLYLPMWLLPVTPWVYVCAAAVVEAAAEVWILRRGFGAPVGRTAAVVAVSHAAVAAAAVFLAVRLFGSVDFLF